MIDSLIPLLETLTKIPMFLDCLNELQMKRITFSKILIKLDNVYKRELIENFRERVLSVEFDGSTDISTEKYDCVVIHYFDEPRKKTISRLWELLPLYDESNDEAGEDAEPMYNLIIQSFENAGIDLRNQLIAFISDGASVMLGVHDSISTRFARDFPGITIIWCICHLLHLSIKTPMERFIDDMYLKFPQQ